MNNELLIGICWSAGAFIVTAFVVYLEYRRDQRRTKRGARRGGKHQTPNARGVIARLNPAGRIETATLPGPLFAEGLSYTFPGEGKIKAKDINDFYYRICGGWAVMQRVAKIPCWCYLHPQTPNIRIIDRQTRKGKYQVSRVMSFPDVAKRDKAFAQFVNIHKAEAAKRGVTVNIWER